MRQSCFYQCTLFVAPVIFSEEIISESINARSFLLHVVLNFACTYNYIYDFVPKGVHENRTKGVENKVDDTLKLVVFLECHSVHGCPFLAVIFWRFFSVL